MGLEIPEIGWWTVPYDIDITTIEKWKLTNLNIYHIVEYFMALVSNLTPPQPNPFEGMCCAKLRNVIWKLFEDPNSSTAAKVSTIIRDSKNMDVGTLCNELIALWCVASFLVASFFVASFFVALHCYYSSSRLPKVDFFVWCLHLFVWCVSYVHELSCPELQWSCFRGHWWWIRGFKQLLSPLTQREWKFAKWFAGAGSLTNMA